MYTEEVKMKLKKINTVKGRIISTIYSHTYTVSDGDILWPLR